MTEELQIVIRAVDAASAELAKVKAVLGDQVDASQKAAESASTLQTQWAHLTSGANFLALGIRRLRLALESIIWGTLIGAIASVAFELINQAKSWLSATGEADRYKKKLDEIKKLNEDVLLLGSKEREELMQRIQLTKFHIQSLGDLVKKKGIEIEAVKLSAQLLESEKERLADLQKQYEILTGVLEADDDTRKKGIGIIRNVQGTMEALTAAAARGHEQERKGLAIATQTYLGWVLREQGLKSYEAAVLSFSKVLGILNAQDIARAEEGRRQELLGKEIRDKAHLEYLQQEQMKVEARANAFRAMASLADAFFIATGSRSKALFNILKAFNIATAIADTYAAANKALNDPTPMPTFARFALAAAITAAGIANVARIASTSMGGSAASGGGGFGAIGSATNPASIAPGSGSQQLVIQPIFNINGVALMDESAMDRLVADLAPSFANLLEGNRGRIGRIVIRGIERS